MDAEYSKPATAETLKKLRELFDGKPWREKALNWLVNSKWILEGQGLEGVTECHANQILNRTQNFFNAIGYLMPPEERAKIRAQDRRKELEAKREEDYQDILPDEYQDVSPEQSPRPDHFNFVVEFFTNGGRPGFSHKGSMLLTGLPDKGKTAACWAGLKALWDNHPEISAEFILFAKFNRLASGRTSGHEQAGKFEDMFNRMLATGFLILDDFGTRERISSSLSELFFELIDTRTQWHRPTVITSNLTAPEIAESLGQNEAKMLRRLNQYFTKVNFNKA